MQHFSPEVWIDYTRDLAAPLHAQALRAHLDEGCAVCAHELAIWSSVRNLAAQARDTQPPAEVLRTVRARFSQRVPSARRGFARLVFDSLLQPLPAGVRAGSSSGRQLLYEAEGTAIDLQLLPSPRHDELIIAGQVLGTSRPERVHVALHTGGATTAAGHCNDAGEFFLSTVATGQLELCMQFDERKAITISLPEDLAADLVRSQERFE